MKALRLEQPGCLALVDIEPPPVRANEVLIRTGACVICTSDLKDIADNPFHLPLPIVLGHEAAGTVAAIGKQVRRFRVGERVAVHPVHPCGHCVCCRDGLGHLCRNLEHLGLNMQGAYAEYFVAREDRVRTVPEHCDWPVAALLEPVCVCLEALNQARLLPGQHLAILGDGPFGVIMARLARLRGLAGIVLAGHHDFRLSTAKPVATLNTARSQSAMEDLIRLADGRGYDAVIATVGRAQAVKLGLDLLKPKGRLVLFAPITGETPVDLAKVVLNELEILGANNDHDLIDQAAELLANPQLAWHELVTHRFPLARFEEAFAIARSGKAQALKVAIVFNPEQNA
jgi:threonine dehydrogenase-like Zn-dependent dehydrogenase